MQLCFRCSYVGNSHTPSHCMPHCMLSMHLLSHAPCSSRPSTAVSAHVDHTGPIAVPAAAPAPLNCLSQSQSCSEPFAAWQVWWSVKDWTKTSMRRFDLASNVSSAIPNAQVAGRVAVPALSRGAVSGQGQGWRCHHVA